MVYVKEYNMIQNLEGEQDFVAGSQIAFSCEYLGSPVISSPTVKVYQGTSDVTSTLIPSGSASVSGSVVNLPTIVIPDPPYRQYVVVVSATVDGVVDPRKIILNCQKKESGL